jgi:iron complex outermembrane receptor protein
MVRAPDFSGYFGFEYNVRKGEGGWLFAANVKYTSSYAVTDPSIWGGESQAAFTARTGLLVPTIDHPSNNNAQLNGTAYVGSSSIERARQGAYALVNASVTWTDETGHLYVRLWGNNITNKTYFVHYRPSSRTYTPIGEPATYGGTIGVKF